MRQGEGALAVEEVQGRRLEVGASQVREHLLVWGEAGMFNLTFDSGKIDTGMHNVIILHPRPRDTGKFAALGPNIMSPRGCLLPPEGRRAGGSRPEGGNRQPEGDIMWPAGG